MSFIKANASNTTVLKSVTAPTAAVSQHAAYCFINGTLTSGEHTVKCPTGIKLTYGQLESMPKLQALLTDMSVSGDLAKLAKFSIDVRIVSGADYQRVVLNKALEDVNDPILKGLIGACATVEESLYYQLIKPLVAFNTPNGKHIKCFPPSFDVRRESLSPQKISELAILHHNFVGKDDVVFTPTSISVPSLTTDEEEEY